MLLDRQPVVYVASAARDAMEYHYVINIYAWLFILIIRPSSQELEPNPPQIAMYGGLKFD